MTNRTRMFWNIGFIAMLGSLAAWWLCDEACASRLPYATLIPFILFPYAFSLAHNAIHAVPLWLARCFAWLGGIWLTFSLYALMGAILYRLVTLVLLMADSSLYPTIAVPFARILLLIIVCWQLYGAWKAYHPIYRHVSLTSPLIHEPLTLALATDIHFSPILSKGYAKRLVQRINATHADVILFGGDIIDAHLEFVCRDKSYTALADLHSKAVFAVYGNHDYFDSDIEKERRLFQPLQFLLNEQVALTDTIALTGLNDYLHEPVNTVPPMVPGKFNILLEHEPFRLVPAQQAGYHLYLAGHTHAGQFFPATARIHRYFTLAYGQRQFGQLTAIISSGYGFWGMPMRSGPSPEIVVVHLAPKTS